MTTLRPSLATVLTHLEILRSLHAAPDVLAIAEDVAVSLQGEIAAEAATLRCLNVVEAELATATHPDVVAALKRVALGILANGFDWDTPDWARKLIANSKYAEAPDAKTCTVCGASAAAHTDVRDGVPGHTRGDTRSLPADRQVWHPFTCA